MHEPRQARIAGQPNVMSTRANARAIQYLQWNIIVKDNHMSIRQCNSSDIESILSLLKELDEALGEDQGMTIESINHQYNEMIKSPDIYENYVYEQEQKVIGFISLLNYKSFYHKNGSTQINELIVSNGYRSKGIGKKLLEFAIERSKSIGMDEIEIGVEKDNYKAIEFYKRNGICDEYLILGKEF